MFETVTLWWHNHADVVGLIVPILAGALNIAMRWKTAEEWLVFGERYPRTATFVRVFRAIFPDPTKAVNSVQDYLNEKADKVNK